MRNDSYYDDNYWEEGSHWESEAYRYRPVQRKPVRKALQQLFDRLGAYDTLRIQLQQVGGRYSDLGRITQMLTKPFYVTDSYNKAVSASLNDPKSVRNAITDAAGHNVHLQARRLETSMPAYAVVRVKEDYYHNYSLVVEEYYRSPDYPLADERFIQLQLHTHERFQLRLSPFRDAARSIVGASAAAEAVDDLLLRVGCHVLGAAWHEDQRVAVMASQLFGLPKLREAIELLYLVLSADLCDVRDAVTQDFENLTQFFEEAYPQPAIGSFLAMLPHLNGEAIDGLPQKALGLYRSLSGEFARFLQTETEWGVASRAVPLYKLLLGNFSRTAMLDSGLRQTQAIGKAAARLTASADGVVREIVSTA